MKDWVVRHVFEEKTKPHVMEMLCSVLEMRDAGEEPEQVQVSDLPKNIAPIPHGNITLLNGLGCFTMSGLK